MIEMFWSEARVIRLKYLYDAGLSYSQIAKDLGAHGRNAVGGKIDRLGLPKRSPIKTPEQRERAKAATAIRNLENRRVSRGTKTFRPSREKKMHQESAALPFEGSLKIPFRDLRDFKHESPNQCRYIADEPPGPDYLACGNETRPGESYCPHCTEMLKPANVHAMSELDRMRRRAHFIKIGNPSKIARTLDNEEAA